MSDPGSTVERMIPLESVADPGCDGAPVELPPPPTLANVTPSGSFVWELDEATRLPDLLSAAELVDGVVGFERVIAWASARQHELIAAFHARPGDGTVRPAADVEEPAQESVGRRAWAADEIGLALTLAPGAADRLMARADRLYGVLRPTRDLLRAGRICPSRARLVADMLAGYDDPVAAAVQARVLPKAPGQTWGQLRAALTRALMAEVSDPDQRHRRARRERRVDLYPGEDGMATLSALLTAAEATASFEWVTRLARGVERGPEAERGRGSMDRRRADVLVALLTGRLVATAAVAGAGDGGGGADDGSDAGGGSRDCGSGVVESEGPGWVVAAPVSAHRPLIHVTVPTSTLLGLDEEPAELAGYGPIPAPVAREIATDPTSTWRRLLTDPASGRLLDLGRRCYRPPAGLAGFVRARDGHCRYPGCSRPAVACELDHVVARQHGGPTSEANLCALCERHHDLKHSGWRVVLHPDRSCDWTTPTGHRYTSRPVDHRPTTPHPPTSPAARWSGCPPATTGPPEPDEDPPPF